MFAGGRLCRLFVLAARDPFSFDRAFATWKWKMDMVDRLVGSDIRGQRVKARGRETPDSIDLESIDADCIDLNKGVQAFCQKCTRHVVQRLLVVAEQSYLWVDLRASSMHWESRGLRKVRLMSSRRTLLVQRKGFTLSISPHPQRILV